MQGSGNGNMRGIIPRAMQQVGIYKTELESKGWQYHMEVSFVEIYNETIRDLLRANAKDDDKHEIKRDANGNTTITDVTMTPVDPNDCAQMDSIMEQAARYRSVGQTLMNERSSRSHSVFTLHLRASNPSQGVVLKGALNLVDLAGSERLDRSGATGDRLRETVAINKSLSALTDVFVALGNKQSHIPFRNSKLTYLLQPALSGDGKTLMVSFSLHQRPILLSLPLTSPSPHPHTDQLVNLSPTEESYFESVCSLRFASQVNQCELGKPKRQMKDATAPSAGGDQVTPATKSQTVSATGKSAPSSSASGPNKKVARKA
jgi:kinesin family protein C1